MRKLSDTRVGSVAQVFSHRGWHFPETGLVYLRNLIPFTIFPQRKIKNTRRVTYLLKSVLIFKNLTLHNCFCKMFKDFLHVSSDANYYKGLLLLYSWHWVLFMICFKLTSIPLCDTLFFREAIFLGKSRKYPNHTIFSIQSNHLQKKENCTWIYNIFFATWLTKRWMKTLT